VAGVYWIVVSGDPVCGGGLFCDAHADQPVAVAPGLGLRGVSGKRGGTFSPSKARELHQKRETARLVPQVARRSQH
jgi:hypothetical protein